MAVETICVFLAALITALATGVGAAPFLLVRSFDAFRLGLANAIAAGLMLGASHNLIAEGTDLDPSGVLIGLLVGLAGIMLAKRWIGEHDTISIADISGSASAKALLIIAVMTVHSFAEGIGVGVSFGGTGELGPLITTAIAIHNIPEGLAISAVLVPRGTPVWKAALWSIFTSLPQPLMAVPAYLFVTTFEALLPIGLGIAAGAMIWMVFAELVPDALENASGESVGMTVSLALVSLWSFQHFVLGHF